MNKSIEIGARHFTWSPLNTRNVHFSPKFLECLFELFSTLMQAPLLAVGDFLPDPLVKIEKTTTDRR
jgi:hypothetical protein